MDGSNFIGCNLNTCTLFLLHVLHFKYHYCPNFEPFGVAFLMPEIFYWSLCFLLLFLCLLFVLKQENCIIPNILPPLRPGFQTLTVQDERESKMCK